MFEHFDPCDDESDKDADDGFEDEVEGDEENDLDPNETEPRTCVALAVTIALRSIMLEELSVAFMADARHFLELFSGPRPEPNPLLYWPSLKWLSFTSSALHYDIDPSKLNGLFLAAARAAKNMPVLRAMELWNTCKHCGGAFRYIVDGRRAYIEWEGSWEVEIQDNVKRAWREVAREHAGADLMVEEPKKLDFQGMFHFVTHSLATRSLVVHDISAAEMVGKKAILPPARCRLPSS